MNITNEEIKKVLQQINKILKSTNIPHYKIPQPTEEYIKLILLNEGVKEDDIIQWWGLSNTERDSVIHQDELFRIQNFLYHRKEQNRSAEEATDQVRKTFPMYGNPEDTKFTTGEDRPLPYELKDRVNIFLEHWRIFYLDDVEYRKDLEKYSSFNAFVREKVRKDLI